MRSATRKPEPKLVAAIAPFCENSPPAEPRGCFVPTGQFRCRICVSQFRCRAKKHFFLVKQGLASDRDLPGCNAMFANELMYITFESKFLSVHPSFP